MADDDLLNNGKNNFGGNDLLRSLSDLLSGVRESAALNSGSVGVGTSAPISSTGGSSGSPTGGSSMFDFDFNFGLGETFDDALTSILEFLNIRLSDRFIKREDGEQGKLFQQILNGLKSVDSGATSIEDFLSSVSGLIPNDTVLQNVTDAAARVQYQGFLRRFGEAGEDVDKLQGVISQYENAGIQNNSIVQSFAQTTGEDILKEVFGESGATIGAGVTVTIEDIKNILTGQVGFEDVVREIFILTKGLLNLPIPDWLPLPAIFKLPTIGEIWDKTFGGIIGDVQDSGCTDEENAVSACAGEIGDAVVGAVGDFGKTVEGKITEVYEGVVGAIDNPEDAVQQVYDWITGIFGEDPQNMPPWIWGVVLGGVLGKEILGGLEDIFGDDVNDDGTIGVPPVETVYGPDDPNPDCVAAGATTDENGGCVCPEGSEYIEASKSCEPTGPVVNKVEEDCTQKGREYNEVTDSCGPCKLDNYEPDSVTGECVEVSVTNQPSGNVYRPSFCESGWEDENGVCYPPGTTPPTTTKPQPCSNGATVESDCTECSDGSAPSAHENGNCSQPLISTTTTPTKTLGYSPDCNKERPTGTVTFDLIEQQRAWDRKCGGGTTGSSNCNSLNRQTREDGSCGDCLPGYVFDEDFDTCIKQEVPVTPTETPTTTETGASASIGSSTGGDFSGVIRGISYTPQPVPEILPPSQFGQFGMLTQAPVQQPSRNTDILGGSIVAGLLGKYMV
jgi:hypothetical protein